MDLSYMLFHKRNLIEMCRRAMAIRVHFIYMHYENLESDNNLIEWNLKLSWFCQDQKRTENDARTDRIHTGDSAQVRPVLFIVQCTYFLCAGELHLELLVVHILFSQLKFLSSLFEIIENWNWIALCTSRARNDRVRSFNAHYDSVLILLDIIIMIALNSIGIHI